MSAKEISTDAGGYQLSGGREVGAESGAGYMEEDEDSQEEDQSESEESEEQEEPPHATLAG